MLDDQEAHLPRRSEPDLQLAQVIAQRAGEAMDAADHLFRVGRGRIADVAARYGMAPANRVPNTGRGGHAERRDSGRAGTRLRCLC
jgi:hypothetical protein